MGLISLNSRKKVTNATFSPFVSILIPTFNEERVIKARIDNLLNLNYPKRIYEIIIVDSGSTDETCSIVSKLIEKSNLNSPKIKLVKESERKGKASAINFGKKFAEGDIILVSDANSLFDSNVLSRMMPHFIDQRIGAVGGRYCVANPENPLGSAESFYWDLEYIMRLGESALDSACLFHGEINAWRKEIIEADTKMLSEDLDMCVGIRRKGYKIKYEPCAMVYEPSAITVADQIKQRKRTTIGTILAAKKHWRYFFPPHDIYSLFIFPSHKLITLLSPFLIISIFILYLFFIDLSNATTHFLISGLIFTLLMATLIFLLPKFKILKKHQSFFLSNIINIFKYVLLNEYLILLAWKDFFSGTYSVLWEKAESSR